MFDCSGPKQGGVPTPEVNESDMMDTTSIALRRRGGLRPTAAGALAALLLALASSACSAESPGSAESGSETLRIAVSIPPLQWVAESLAPEGSRVVPLVDPGVSPHGAALSPSQARDLAGADVVLLVGWNLEPSIERSLATSRNSPRVLRMAEVLEGAGIVPPPLFSYETGLAEIHDHADSEPGHEHHEDTAPHAAGHAGHDGHHHGPEDPHAWLDPAAMEPWIRAVADVLGSSPHLVDRTLAEVAQVDREYREALADVRNRVLVTHHDGFGWLVRRYGLEVGAVIRPEGLVETRPSDVARVMEVVRRHDLGGIFVEPQFGDRAALRIRDLAGVELFILDPLGSGDWPATMRANLTQLTEGLNREPAPLRTSAAGMGGLP